MSVRNRKFDHIVGSNDGNHGEGRTGGLVPRQLTGWGSNLEHLVVLVQVTTCPQGWYGLGSSSCITGEK